MARPPKADYRPLMEAAAHRMLMAGEDLTVAGIASDVGVSPGLVHFYFGDRQALVDAAWRSIFMAFVDSDLDDTAAFAEANDWNGVNELVQRIFARDRDSTHLTHVRASVESRSNQALADLLAESTENTVASWKTIMDRYIEAGVADTPLDTEALATLFVAVPMGVAVVAPSLSDEQREMVAQAWATMIRAVLEPGFELPAAGD